VQPMNSAITGALAQVETLRNSTGQPPSATESARLPTVEEVAKARAWLVARKPAEVDQAIQALLTSQLGARVSENREWRFPPDKPAYQVVTSAGITGLSKETQPLAIAKARMALTPVSYEEAERLASQLGILPRRNMSETTAETAFDVYIRMLMDHPADVATEVVRLYVTEPNADGGPTWFPSPPEVEARLRARSAFRKALLEAVLWWKEPPPRDEEADRLREAWAVLEDEAKRLNHKVGPGPITDTGARGERIAAWEAARDAAGQAREAYEAHCQHTNASNL